MTLPEASDCSKECNLGRREVTEIGTLAGSRISEDEHARQRVVLRHGARWARPSCVDKNSESQFCRLARACSSCSCVPKSNKGWHRYFNVRR